MHIAIFHERFIFRFGVDRVLLCLAKEFVALGHKVTLVGQTFDGKWISDENIKFIKIPSFDPYIESDLNTARWIQENWKCIFVGHEFPTIALVAGWPFFQTIGLLKSKNVQVWFQDHGIAPDKGFDEGHCRTIRHLKKLKAAFCRFADGIAPVSHFIADSQSRNVAAESQKIRIITNGVDHALISEESIQKRKDCMQTSQIFSIGRFEAGVYKQSEQVFHLAFKLKRKIRNLKVYVLAENNISIPKDLQGVVIPTGFLSDESMFHLMSSSAACVCFSIWEGFNLNFAEAQALKTPCFVYNCAAHPEVAGHPWLLCDSLDEIITKCEALLNKKAPPDIQSKKIFQDYYQTRTWRHSALNFLEIFKNTLAYPSHSKI